MLIRDSTDPKRDFDSTESVKLVNLETDNQTNDDQSIEDEIFIEEDEYYRVGDHIDALDSDTGAWFEATIATISSNKSGFVRKYYVNFEKESIGSNVALSLQQIRPQSTKLIAFDELKEGQVVLANFTTDDSQQRGYWYECRIDNKVLKDRALYGSICMADVMLDRQRIRLIDEIYAIETNLMRSERSPDHQKLIRFGPKAKRESYLHIHSFIHSFIQFN